MCQLDHPQIVEIANNLGRTIIREEKSGDIAAADRARERFNHLFTDMATFPHLALADTIVRLGRHNAFALEIDRQLIANAMAMRRL